MKRWSRRKTRTVRRRKTWRRKSSYKGQNPLLRRKVGQYYKTSFTAIYPLVTTNTTPTWAPMTVQLLGQIGPNAPTAFYKDANQVSPDLQKETFDALFDQSKITGCRLKIVIPPSSGNIFSFRQASTAQVTSINFQPSRALIAFDPNDQIGIEATQEQLVAKTGFQDLAIPQRGVISRYFRNEKALKSVGLGTGWTECGDLTYGQQLAPGTGPSVHVRLLTSFQGQFESIPDGLRLGQLELTYYITYRGKKTG